MSAKLERLLNLTAALLETRQPLTAQQIRRRVPGYPEELASFRRTFERDKEDLREMGIPLRMTRVEQATTSPDAYWIPADEYYLRDPGLLPDELAALHLASRVIDAEAATEALWKLGGVEPGGSGARAGERGPVRVAAVPVDERLAVLFDAVAARRVVRFDYGKSPRTFEPHRLDYQKGRWYASGHDQGRGELRTFRLDRMGTTVRATGATFARPATRHPGVRLQPWESGGEPAVEARLLVDADQAGWATHHLGEERIEEHRSDGGVVFRIPVTNRDAFRSFVLTFLDHAEVLGPEDVREELVGWLEAVAQPGGVEAGGVEAGGAGPAVTT
jgi:proteasome accessory factor B